MRWLQLLLLLMGSAMRLSGQQCPDGTLPPCRPRVAGRGAVAQPPATPELIRLTSNGKVSATLAVSPDGRTLAYVEEGVLYVRPIDGTGAPTEVTRQRGVVEVTSVGGGVTSIRWLPDNARLVTRGDSGVFVISALGGTPRRILSGSPIVVAVSRDGRTVLAGGPINVFSLIDVESGAIRPQRLPVADEFFAEAVFSPDGLSLATLSIDARTRYRLSITTLATGENRVLLTDSVRIADLAWDAATSSLVFRRTGADREVRRLPVLSDGAAAGPLRSVTNLIDGDAMSLFDDGRHAVFRRVASTSNFIPRGLAGDTSSRRITSDSTFNPRAGGFSPDGRFMAYVRSAGDDQRVFVSRSDSLAPTQVMELHRRSIVSLVWSTDGRRLAHCSVGSGGIAIGVVEVATRAAITLNIRDASDTCMITWGSPETLYYHMGGNRNFGTYSLTGSPRGILVGDESVGFIFSLAVDPRGERGAVYWNRRGGSGVWLLDLRGNAPARRVGASAYPIRFSPDGATVVATLQPTNPTIVRQRVEQPDRSDTLRVAAPCTAAMDVTPDQTKVLCWVVESSRRDIWVVRNFDTSRPGASSPIRP